MAWSQHANIHVWFTSWWGPNSREDNTLRSRVVPTLENSALRFAIFYESINRIGKTNPSTRNVVKDINHICDHFLNHANYYRINERPVLVVYLTRFLQQVDILAETLLLMRSTAAKKGHNLYIVGDHAFGPPPTTSLPAFDYLDAITNYDVYGTMGRFYVGDQAVKSFYRQQAAWRTAAKNQSCAYIPSVTPGYNDRGVRLDANNEPLSRKLNANAEFGSFFRSSLREATGLLDGDADGLLVTTSFNEWHEDTQIEPATGNLTNAPYEYTLGLEYEGYGTRYLDILSEMTFPLGLPPFPSPTLAPTLPPTRAPTFPPSFPPTRAPTLPPTRPPTLPPQIPPTPLPTKAPISIPTLKPSHAASLSPSALEPGNSVPSDAPSGNVFDLDHNGPNVCDDSLDGTFVTLNNGPQRCVWLAARPDQQSTYCLPTLQAFHLCEETCGKCTDNCQDTNGFFEYNGALRNCLWLSLRINVIQSVCVAGNPAFDSVCTETCNACDR
jgi:hypothetical protein